jgi:subtilisin family serine protease
LTGNDDNGHGTAVAGIAVAGIAAARDGSRAIGRDYGRCNDEYVYLTWDGID